MRQKIFIVGSSGFLGSEIVKQLKKIKNIKILYLRRNSKFKDFTDKKNIKNILGKLTPNIVINCAAMIDVDKCEKDKKDCKKTNVDLVKNLSEYSILKKIYLVHISTDQIYNAPGKKFSKESKVKILNYYSKTKFIAEKYVNAAEGLVLRVNFFGKNIKRKKGFVNWLMKMNRESKKINLFDNIYFNPLHVSTLARIIIKILYLKKYGVYNLGSLDNITKYEFAKKISQALNLKLNYNKKKYSSHLLTAKRPLNMSMNTFKFRKTFNINLPKVEDEIIKVKSE